MKIYRRLNTDKQNSSQQKASHGTLLPIFDYTCMTLENVLMACVTVAFFTP